MTTSTIRVAKHRKAKRDAGLVRLSERVCWVHAAIKAPVEAEIERLIAEYDARKAVGK